MTTPTDTVPLWRGMNQVQPLPSKTSLVRIVLFEVGGIKRVRNTVLSLEKWLALLWGSNPILNSPLKISPAGNVLEILVEGTVLQVLGAYDTSSATGVNKV